MKKCYFCNKPKKFLKLARRIAGTLPMNILRRRHY